MKFKQARNVLKRYDARVLTKTKNVNGVAIGKEDEQWVIKVFVTKRLRSHRWLEKLKLGGLPVRVEQVGEIKALQERTEKWRPSPGGVSIGHFNITAGTLGCVVYKNGRKYILSNNHILADSNSGGVGDAIYQPGPIDGGTEDDEIGELSDYVPIVFNDLNRPNYVDAALCEPNSESDVLDSLLGLGYPCGHREAKIGDEVTKSGRSTGVNEGTITAFTGLLEVTYGPWLFAYFDDQVLTSVMHEGGDSGSLLVDKETGEAVGLLFAGSSTFTVHSRATKVAEALGIEFYGEPEVTLEAAYDILPFEAGIKFYRCASWSEGDTHGGDIDLTQEIVPGTERNVFDDVTNAERVSGAVEYRKIYIRNENVGVGSLWEAVLLWISTVTPAENDEISITAQGTNSDTQASAKSYTYYQPSSRVHTDAQSVGSLAANGYHHIWIKRQVSAAGPGYPGDGFTLAFGRSLSSSWSSSFSSSFSSSSKSSISTSFSSSSESSISTSFSSSSESSISTSFSSSSSSSASPTSVNQGAWQDLEQGAWQTIAAYSSFSFSSSSGSFSSSSSSTSSPSFSSSSSSFSSSSFSSSSFSSSSSSSFSSSSSSCSSSSSSSFSSSSSSCSSSSCSSSSSSSFSSSSSSCSYSSSSSFSSSSFSSSSSSGSYTEGLNQGAWDDELEQGAWQK